MKKLIFVGSNLIGWSVIKDGYVFRDGLSLTEANSLVDEIGGDSWVYYIH